MIISSMVTVAAGDCILAQRDLNQKDILWNVTWARYIDNIVVI